MDRVKTWCKYTWDNQKTFDERTILQHLPEKLMTGHKIHILIIPVNTFIRTYYIKMYVNIY